MIGPILLACVLNAPVCVDDVCVPPVVTQGVEVTRPVGRIVKAPAKVARGVLRVAVAPLKVIKRGIERRRARRAERGRILGRLLFRGCSR